MTTDKAPDFAAIAHNAARAWFFAGLRKDQPGLSEIDAEFAIQMDADRVFGYASCMEARLRSDWETIRLLREARLFVRRDVKVGLFLLGLMVGICVGLFLDPA
jgi:hypothetical protein